MVHRFSCYIALTSVCGLALCGCSPEPGAGLGTPQQTPLALPNLSLLKLPSAAPPATGTPLEIYTRVARGAVTCWFGANGPLKGGYVYHAQADPPSKGGNARIVIHSLDQQRQDKRGARAFAVDIAPDGTRSKVGIKNVTIPDPLGTRMIADVRRWAGKRAGCNPTPLTAGWTPQDKAAGRTPKTAKKSKKSKK